MDRFKHQCVNENHLRRQREDKVNPESPKNGGSTQCIALLNGELTSSRLCLVPIWKLTLGYDSCQTPAIADLLFMSQRLLNNSYYTNITNVIAFVDIPVVRGCVCMGTAILIGEVGKMQSIAFVHNMKVTIISTSNAYSKPTGLRTTIATFSCYQE